ncbi:hypothetical protein Chor_014795 [Crotalus horridus]
MARVGGMVSPLTNMLQDYYPFLPPIVYGALPISAGIIACLLPETLNVPLPDTIEDVENRKTKKKNEEEIAQEKILLQRQEKVLFKETC